MEKARLSIITSLATHQNGLLFNDLKELCSLTDGNLSRHLQLLSEGGLVQIWKGFKDNRPQTLCQLSDEGRRRFLEYITVLENVVSNAERRAIQTEETEVVPRIADIYAALNASRAYVYTVARACDARTARRRDAASCILFAAEHATQAALEAIQALGGNGYINDYAAGRLLRDAKLYEIGAGTQEIRRMLIGRELFEAAA